MPLKETAGSPEYAVSWRRKYPFVKSFYLLPILLAVAGTSALAQTFEPVFPGESGQALLDSLATHYRPAVVLDYANARDTLYAKVLAFDDDSLRCIYSGHTLYLDPNQDPTQYVYLNGTTLGMNTEHAYPQSKGAADGNARSDMHHLFPARIPVNEARGDVPYGEISDAQTERWFRGAQVLFSTPAQNKDQYSEWKNGVFEPREKVKGDLARAVFYFYTMYRSQANAADPNYFATQRATLCQWNEQDPADSAELVKTWRIAPYQENKPNPFILDCTLAYRTWCPEVAPACSNVSVTGPVLDLTGLKLTPNPFTGSGTLAVRLPFSGTLRIRLISATGQKLGQWEIPEAAQGAFEFALGAPAAARQLSILTVELRNETRYARGAIKVFPIR